MGILESPFIVFIIVALRLLFLAAIHPIWGIVDSAISIEHAKNTKIIWILLMVFTGIFSSVFYGIFVTKSRTFKPATAASILPFLVLLTFAFLNPDANNTGSKANANRRGQAVKAQHIKTKVKKKYKESHRKG